MNEQPFRIVTNLRKAGNLQEAWNAGFKALEQNPQDNYLKGALFWVCYEYLKQAQDKINRRAAASSNFRPNDFEFEQIENLLQHIVNLNIPVGGLEYKMLLVQFKKNLECFPTLIHFVLRHQEALFDNEAKTPFQAEKGELPSLMLSSARQIAQAWLRARDYWQIDLFQVLNFIDITRQQVADTKNLIWLDYDQSKCFIVSGQFGKARDLLLPILRKKQKEAWAWGALAASYQKQDPHLALKFYAKGIISAHDVTFSLKLLKGAIPLLLSNNQIIEASMCLKTATQTYLKNGWRLKPELEQLTTQPWYNSSVDENKLFGFLTSICSDATSYLHGTLEKVIGVVASIHKSGKGFEVFINRSQSLSVRMNVHKSKALPKLGDFVELSVPVESIEKEVVASVLSQARSINDVSNIDGDLKISDKGFGFVGDTFVPPFVVNNFSNGSRVSALRIMSWDKVKSRYSWKAVKLTGL